MLQAPAHQNHERKTPLTTWVLKLQEASLVRPAFHKHSERGPHVKLLKKSAICNLVESLIAGQILSNDSLLPYQSSGIFNHKFIFITSVSAILMGGSHLLHPLVISVMCFGENSSNVFHTYNFIAWKNPQGLIGTVVQSVLKGPPAC